jgi:predicted cupin superfamily sugar epimerase
MQSGLTAAEIVAALGMERHPEGGWWAQSFQDIPVDGRRAVSSAIYFLLERGDRSNWHRIRDAAEVWHFHAGAPLELAIHREGGVLGAVRLGTDLAGGERPQAVVPADWWQTAKSLGDWTLVGCTVAPGFEFSSFELAPPGWEPGQERNGT